MLFSPESQVRSPDPLRTAGAHTRVFADGKHLSCGEGAFRVRGVTYGSFLRRPDGFQYPEPDRLEDDLRRIAGMGLNTIRVYDLPPVEMLDLAGDLGLRLIVGVHVRDWRYHPAPGRRANRLVLDSGRRAIDDAMAVCAGRDEVLAISVGNEVPGDIVRAHGIGAVEDVLGEFVRHTRKADPDVLVTYTNYPTTEFLHVEGQTLATFNVFLEDPASMRRYLAHLQAVTGHLPLVLTELGLASQVHGLDGQAAALEWQLREVDRAGCAGATVFAYTDEWGVNGEEVHGWGFGITTKERVPKPACDVVAAAAGRNLVDLQDRWPSISVVVCAYNEERTIGECLESLTRCDYPGLEVIMCDDGSADRTLEIARRFPFRVLELPHGGLSRARNAGIDAANGEIVAFLDADAACHPEWPWHLGLSFGSEDVVASGGPNLAVPGAPFVERAVAASPGAPTEVLIGDDRAEHVPGCNMAFRRDALVAVGGFDPVYTSAGDDVDVCWKLLDTGGAIAFSPAAQVRHHRRGTVRGYLRQQRGYGRAEKLLAPAHRHRFNALGQARWAGVIYGGARLLPSLLRPVVYHGHQGHAPFQTITGRPAERAGSWVGAIEPVAAPIAALGLLLAFVHSPLWLLVPALVTVLLLAYLAAVACALHVPHDEPRPVALRMLVGMLHVAQPFVRTWGRLRGPRRPAQDVAPLLWNGDRVRWLEDLDRTLRADGASTRIGGPRDGWDLEVRSMGGRSRVTAAVAWRWEPHWRVTTSLRPRPLVVAVAVGVLAAVAAPWAAILPALYVPTALIGAGRSRRSVRRAIGRTTEGA